MRTNWDHPNKIRIETGIKSPQHLGSEQWLNCWILNCDEPHVSTIQPVSIIKYAKELPATTAKHYVEYCATEIKMKKNAAGNRGFTLIELMVTLSVSALLLSVGIPGFQGLIRDNRMTTQYNQFLAGLNIARSEAVKRGVGVTICDRNAAGNNCNNTGNWENGWIVFTDLDTDGVVDAGENILRVHQALEGNNTLRAALVLGRNRVTYNSQGFAVQSNGTFRLCDNRGTVNAKGLVLSLNGRPRRAIDGDADGIVEDGVGNSIICP